VKIDHRSDVPDAKGNFAIRGRYNLYPWEHMIDTDAPPVGYYLDSIRLGGSDKFEPGIRISSGDQSLTLTYKHGGGIVRGMVASCGFGVVKLVARDAALRHPASFAARGAIATASLNSFRFGRENTTPSQSCRATTLLVLISSTPN
jgi:hypothetical protein